MAPIVLDLDADTTIYVIQKDGKKLVNRVELRVLAAALEKNSYWKKFAHHMGTTIGFRPNKEHIEDKGISTTAVEIVLRALHFDYHLKLIMESEDSEPGGDAKHDGATDKDEQGSGDAAASRGNGPAIKIQTEKNRRSASLLWSLPRENRARLRIPAIPHLLRSMYFWRTISPRSFLRSPLMMFGAFSL